MYVDDSAVTGNVLHDVGGTGVSTEACDGLAVTGNRLRDIGGAGITLISAVSGCEVTGNTIRDVGENGIWAQGGTDSSWTGNVVVGAGQTAGTWYGIRITSGASHYTIAGNRIRQGTGTLSDAVSITSSCDRIKVYGTHADAGGIVNGSTNSDNTANNVPTAT